MSELQKMKIEELHKELETKREELRKFRFDITGTKIKNIKEGRNIKRNIARVLTELRKREIKLGD